MEYFNFVDSLFPKIRVDFLLFGLIFIIYWLYVFVIIYHLTRFGVGPRPKVVAFVFFIGAVVLFIIPIQLLNTLNLTALTQKINFKNLFNINILPPNF